jgi:hypothetical protein
MEGAPSDCLDYNGETLCPQSIHEQEHIIRRSLSEKIQISRLSMSQVQSETRSARQIESTSIKNRTDRFEDGSLARTENLQVDLHGWIL